MTTIVVGARKYRVHLAGDRPYYTRIVWADSDEEAGEIVRRMEGVRVTIFEIEELTEERNE